MANLTQEQLDTIVRRESGKHAVEQMTYQDEGIQVYLLDNGWEIMIRKHDGTGDVRRQLRARWIVVREF